MGQSWVVYRHLKSAEEAKAMSVMSPPSKRSMQADHQPSTLSVNGLQILKPSTRLEVREIVQRWMAEEHLMRAAQFTRSALSKAQQDGGRWLRHLHGIASAGSNFGLMSRLLGSQRVPDGQWALEVLNEARRRGLRVFVLGSDRDETFSQARIMAMNLKGLELAGAHAPSADFRDEDGDLRLARRIEDAGADVIVAFPRFHRGEEFPFRAWRHLRAQFYMSFHGFDPVRSLWSQ